MRGGAWRCVCLSTPRPRNFISINPRWRIQFCLKTLRQISTCLVVIKNFEEVNKIIFSSVAQLRRGLNGGKLEGDVLRLHSWCRTACMNWRKKEIQARHINRKRKKYKRCVYFSFDIRDTEQSWYDMERTPKNLEASFVCRRLILLNDLTKKRKKNFHKNKNWRQ